MIIPYASRTGSRRQLAYAWENSWRLLVSAEGVQRHEGMPYAIDNGAWHIFQRLAMEMFGVAPKDLTPPQATEVARRAAVEWSSAKFYQLCNKLGRGADWIATPDIVCGGAASLRRSLAWLPYVLRFAPALIPVQDGMTPEELEPIVGSGVGIFIGGSTEWKLETLGGWCALGRRAACWVHVGRVNSAKRIEYCSVNGATSFDGSGPSRFVKEMERLDGAVVGALSVRSEA